MRNEYKREMDGLGPRPEELERLYAMIEGGTGMKRRKWLGCRAAAAIAVCAVLMATAAAAAAPTVWEAIAGQLGVFAPYAETIEGAACEDQGIEVQVLSALSDDLETRVYLSVRDVEGDRLNQFLTLDGKLVTGEMKELDPENQGALFGTFGFASTSYFKLVSYDEGTRTALFLARILYADTTQPTGEAKLSVTGMGSRKAKLEAQPFGGNISCASVTGEVLKSLPAGREDKVVHEPEDLEGLGLDNSVLPGEHIVLAPGQTPMDIAGTGDMRVSSMGFASDGCFHIRFEFADGVAPETFEPVSRGMGSGASLPGGQVRSMMFCDLVNGKMLEPRMSAIRETLVEGGMDVTFPLVTVDDLEELRGWEARFYGSYTRPGIEVEGDWSVEFQMDYYPSTVLDWTGELAGCQVRQVTVSPLTVTMHSNNTGEFCTTLYAVKKDGTTVAAEPGASRYINLDAKELAGPGGPEAGVEKGYDAFNTWNFEEPVDLDDVVSLKLGDGTVPMN